MYHILTNPTIHNYADILDYSTPLLLNRLLDMFYKIVNKFAQYCNKMKDTQD